MKIIHQADYLYRNTNTLSQLPIEILNHEYAIQVQSNLITLLNIEDDLKLHISQGIQHNPIFTLIYNKIMQYLKQDLLGAEEYYSFHWDTQQQLLFYIRNTNTPCLCIP